MPRLSLFLAAMTAATSLSAARITFLKPLDGAQVIGPAVIEVTTDATDVNRVEFYVDGVLAGVARTSPYRIVHDFGAVLASRQITAKVLSNGYRNSDAAGVVTAALTAGESIDVDLVEVPIRVRSGRTLKPEDVRVRENSTEQSVREIRPGRGPAHFAFVVDRSASMGDGKLTAALQAVQEARKLLRKDDSYSITLFNHNVDRDVEATQSVVPSGGTSLRDAVAASVSGRRTCAIVISDGGDRNSELSEEEALRRISGTKTIVAGVVLGRSSKFLTRAAANTGGSLLHASAATVGAAVQRIITDINSRYTLVYQSRGNDRGWRSISVTARRGNVQILAARKGYFAE